MVVNRADRFRNIREVSRYKKYQLAYMTHRAEHDPQNVLKGSPF